MLFCFPNLSFKDHFQLIIGILLSPTFPAGKRLVQKDSDKKIPPAKKESPIEKAPSLGANCEFLGGGVDVIFNWREIMNRLGGMSESDSA